MAKSYVAEARRKKVLEDFYDREPELEGVFNAEGKTANLRKIAPPEGARFTFIRQRQMGGTGDAVRCDLERLHHGRACVLGAVHRAARRFAERHGDERE